MMVPRKSLILAGAALTVFGVSASAQSQKTKLFKRAGGSVREAQLDLSTGTYTRGPIVNDRGVATVADFQNLDAFDGSGFGWLSVDTGAGACQWFSNAAKGAGLNQSQNASDLVRDFIFFYCSNALDVNSGGAGGSVELGFYEGFTVFGGSPTTVVGIFNVTELPANTSDGSFFSAGAGCFGIQLTVGNLGTLIHFGDNAFIGYSWGYADVGTDGILGNTYPFISCVVSCSGNNIINGSAGGAGTNTGLGEDGQGQLDVIDQLCVIPAGTVRATFTFGTTAPPFAPTTRVSVNMQVQEAGDFAATNLNYNAATTPNADTLSATKAIIGANWSATLTRASGTGGTMLVTVRRARHPLPNGGNPVAPVTGRVLIAGAFLAQVPAGGAQAIVGSSGTVVETVPLAYAFCGLHIAAQCRTTGGGIRLSSGVEGTIGTF
jgi:hypothetical protein